MSPLGPPSGASTGRQSTAQATRTARPTTAFDRAAATASVAARADELKAAREGLEAVRALCEAGNARTAEAAVLARKASELKADAEAKEGPDVLLATSVSRSLATLPSARQRARIGPFRALAARGRRADDAAHGGGVFDAREIDNQAERARGCQVEAA